MYDFPASPNPGDEYTPPVGGQTYIWQPPRWLVKGIPPAGGGGGGGGIDEAPVDTRQYGRQDAAWTEVVANPTWTTLSGKPSTFPPTLPIAYTDISGKPATFPPTLPIAQADVTGLVAGQAAQDTAISGKAAVTAQTRNRIINGAMQVSQENGNTAGTGTSRYGADQFVSHHTGTPTITTQRVQVVTPNGSKDRYRLTVTVADAALAAGDYLIIQSVIEGVRTADFRYGSAQAKQSILRFGFKAPAGTYSISLRNEAHTRCYLANFTISAGQANTDTEQTLIIPGDITGTWLTDTNAGIELAIALAAGTTFQGATGWNAGSLFGTSANSNGMATAAAVFELFDVGFYLDPLATGVAPPWVMPDEAEELRACQRYYDKGTYATHANVWATGFFKATMRIAPAVTSSPAISNGPTGNTGGFVFMHTSTLTATFAASARF